MGNSRLRLEETAKVCRGASPEVRPMVEQAVALRRAQMKKAREAAVLAVVALTLAQMGSSTSRVLERLKKASEPWRQNALLPWFLRCLRSQGRGTARCWSRPDPWVV